MNLLTHALPLEKKKKKNLQEGQGQMIFIKTKNKKPPQTSVGRNFFLFSRLKLPKLGVSLDSLSSLYSFTSLLRYSQYSQLSRAKQ